MATSPATVPTARPAAPWRFGRIDWGAAVWAGVISGLVFLALDLLKGPLVTGASAWAVPRNMAAVLLGPGVLPPPATFDLGIFAVAMVVHFATSILFAIAMAFIIRDMPTGLAIVVATALGVLLYFFISYTLTPILPWFAKGRDWLNLGIHIPFGLVAGWAYKALADRATGRRAMPRPSAAV